jgi:hypothetical protein
MNRPSASTLRKLVGRTRKPLSVKIFGEGKADLGVAWRGHFSS